MDVRHLIGKAAGVPRTRGDEPYLYSYRRPRRKFSPRVWGRMRGDEPDRHAYMLDFGQIVVYLPRTQFRCKPEKATVSRRWLIIIDG